MTTDTDHTVLPSIRSSQFSRCRHSNDSHTSPSLFLPSLRSPICLLLLLLALLLFREAPFEVFREASFEVFLLLSFNPFRAHRKEREGKAVLAISLCARPLLLSRFYSSLFLPLCSLSLSLSLSLPWLVVQCACARAVSLLWHGAAPHWLTD